MASDSRTLSIQITAEDNATKTINGVTKSVEGFGKTTVNQLKDAKIALAAGLAATTAFAVTSVQAFMESEDAAFGLQSALINLSNTGENITGVESRITELASSLQGMSRQSDEAIMSASTLMLRLGVGTQNIDAATKAALDLSSAMGMDLQSAAQAVGLALAYPDEALGRLRRQGIIFTNDQEEMIKKWVEMGDTAKAQAFILGELGDRFEGAAARGASTFGGQLDIVKNKVNDIQETIGKGFVDALTGAFGGTENLTKALDRVNTILKENKSLIMIVVGAVGGMILVFGGLLVAALVAAAGAASAFVLAFGFAAGAIGALVGVIITQWDGIVWMFNNAKDSILTALSDIWNGMTVWVTNMVNGIMSFAAQTWAQFTGWITGIVTAWNNFWTNLPANFINFVATIVALWTTFWTQTLPFAVGYFIGFVGSAILNFLTVTIPETIMGMITFVTETWNNFWNVTLPTILMQFVTWILTTLPQLVAQVHQWFTDMKQRVSDTITLLMQKAIQILTSLWEWITTNISSWPGKVQGFLSTLPTLVGEIFDNMKKAIQTKIDEMWQGIKDFGDKVIGVFNSIKDAIGGAISKATEGVKAGVKGFTSRQFGGFVPQTGLVLLHEGEFVMSKDMMAGRSPVPSGIQQTFNQPITINPTLSGEPDFDLLGYKLAWVLRNSR